MRFTVAALGIMRPFSHLQTLAWLEPSLAANWVCDRPHALRRLLRFFMGSLCHRTIYLAKRYIRA